MSVWYAIPSAREAEEVAPIVTEWKFRGCRVALYRDPKADDVQGADVNFHAPYQGYAHAVNTLVRQILANDPEAEWIATGGDDIMPDPHKSADEIARECTIYFGGTLGIMQPTGDRHMEDGKGTCAAERVCVSPWLGREWCVRSYGGKGPFCEEYFHFFVDEELHDVATALGLLWHRRDLSQHHKHWMRQSPKQRPEHLKKAAATWAAAKKMFTERKAAGFPGSALQ